jgi:hypothetical protein
MNAASTNEKHRTWPPFEVPVRMCEGGSSTPPEQQTEGPSKPNYYKVLGVSFGVRPRLRRRHTLRVLQRNARLLADTDAPVRINTPWCCTQQADFNQLRSAYLRLALVRPPAHTHHSVLSFSERSLA